MQLMKDLRQTVGYIYVVPLYCDNESAICLAENPFFHARTKYVEIYYHFIWQKVLQGEIGLEHIKMEHNIADFFTKGFSVNKLKSFCKQLRMVKKES